MPNFLENEQCSICQGPILNEPHTKTIFEEDLFNYITQTVWICYACGHEQTLQSEPYYSL